VPKGDYQRLKADVEDGAVPIARLLLEAVSMAKLNGVAKGLVIFIWRRTYGWMDVNGRKHKSDRITLAEFAQATGSAKTYVSSQLKLLVKAHVIEEQSDPDNGRYKQYGMNTDVSGWDKVVLNTDDLHQAIETKLYVHSTKNGTLTVQQTRNRSANAKGLTNAEPLSNSITTTFSKCVTFRSDNPSGGAGSDASKERSTKEIKIAVAATPYSPPSRFDDEVEAVLRQHMGNPHYRLVGTDFHLLKELVADGVSGEVILQGMAEGFERYRPRFDGDKISSFSYFRNIIRELWRAVTEREQAHLQVAVGQVKRAESTPRNKGAPKAGNSLGSEGSTANGQRDPRYAAFYELFPDTT